MTDSEAKACVIEYARTIDRIVAAIERVEKDMEKLTAVHESLILMYTETADRIERLAAEFERKDLAEKVLTIALAMKARTTKETKN